MTSLDPSPAPPPPSPPFQFSLRTLLLLFVVLGSSLGVFGAWGVVVFGLVVGLAICIHIATSFPSRAELVVIIIVLLFLIALLLPTVQSGRDSGHHSACCNHLKQIALALHAYHQANGCFPPAYVADKNGKPMHSWRVLILPFLEEAPLYKTYNFNEPWDGPNNKKLLASRPRVYACPSDSDAYTPSAAQTSYVAVVGPNAAWAGAKSRSLRSADFGGQASHQTVMVVETADSGVAWTDPRDLSLDAIGTNGGKSSGLSVSSHHGRVKSFFFVYEHTAGANVAIVDGSVWWLPPDVLSREDLRNILQVGGCPFYDPDFESQLQNEGQRRPNWPNIAALAVWLLSVGTLLTCAVRSRKLRSVPATPPAS